MGVALLILLGAGGFAISMYRHEAQYIKIMQEFIPREGWTSVSPLKLQGWPVKPPYTNTYSATGLAEIEMELYHQVELGGFTCMHASSLGVPVDTTVVRVDDTLYIVRDVTRIEYMGVPRGGYHVSILNTAQLAFANLYPEINVEFITAYQFQTTGGARHIIKSPLHVASSRLAHCMQLYYPKT
jgi:hypothetical protein